MLKVEYVIAFVAACLILAGGAGFCAHTRQSLIKHLRQQMNPSENSDETSKELAAMLDQGLIPPNFGTEVPSSLLRRMLIAELLAALWYVWVVVAFGACFAVAHFLTRRHGQGGGA